MICGHRFGAIEALENCSAGREEIDREQRRKTLRAENEHAIATCVNLIPQDDKHVVRQSRELIPLLQLWYCNSCEGLCQALHNKIRVQNLIRSKQRKGVIEEASEKCFTKAQLCDKIYL